MLTYFGNSVKTFYLFIFHGWVSNSKECPVQCPTTNNRSRIIKEKYIYRIYILFDIFDMKVSKWKRKH